MLKDISIFVFAFVLGFSIGDSDESKLRENFENWILKLKDNGDDIKKVLLNTLNNIEGIETDEIKFNLERLISLIKEKLNQLISVEGFSDKISQTKIEEIEKNKKTK